MGVVIGIIVFILFCVMLIAGSISSREKEIRKAIRTGFHTNRIVKVNKQHVDTMIRDIKYYDSTYGLNDYELSDLFKKFRWKTRRLVLMNQYILPKSLFDSIVLVWETIYPAVHAPIYEIQLDLSGEMDEGKTMVKQFSFDKSKEDDNYKMALSYEVIEDDSSYEDDEEEEDYIDEMEMYDAIFDDDDEW